MKCRHTNKQTFYTSRW